jgi:hypothetical protein
MADDGAPSYVLRWIAALAVALVCAAGAAAALAPVVPDGDVVTALRASPLTAAALVAAPLVAALLAGALLARVSSRAAAPAAVDGGATATPIVSTPPDDTALRLLGLLQQEGRFVDFVEEDLGAYSDEQIGSAVRAIHAGCRSALRDRLVLSPILAGDEGATVTVERGFDPAAVRVTGNVRGEPPYRGVLRHPGWRTDRISLPERTGGDDASILAPAEVEIP